MQHPKFSGIPRAVQYLAVSFCLIVSGSGAIAQSETYSWHNVAMGGGGFVTGLITGKTGHNLMYARTDVGGAYRWDPLNSKWIPLLDWVSEAELGYLGVESLAIDPVEPSKVYMLVGTSYFNNGKSAILRSSDYGNTFSVADVTGQFKAHGNGMGRQTGEKLIVDPNQHTTIYCGTRANGLFRSSDSGLTWNRLPALDVTTTSNGNGISFVILDPSTGSSGNATQTVIAGISRKSSANIFRSDDGGLTFNEVSGAPTTLMPHRGVLSNDGNLYITYTNNAGPWDISGAGAIWKYNIASGLWTNVTPAGFDGAFGGISIDPSNANRLVASSINSWQFQDNGWGDRIFVSSDAGNSWTDIVSRGFDLDPNDISWIDGSSIHWAGSIEFDPIDSKKVWVVSGNGIFQTDDIDATTSVWKFQVRGLEETVPLDMMSIPNGPLVSSIGDYGGFRHDDVREYGDAHSPHMGTTYGVAYATLNPKMMLRIGENKMYYSEDIGLTWTECARTGTKGSVSISADGKIFLYSPESGKATYRSTDKGVSWTLSSGLAFDWTRPLADPVNALKFYVYDPASGSVMVSADGGKSFRKSASPGTGGSKIIRATPDREGDVWIPLYGSGLARSVNSAETFSKLPSITHCAAVGFGKEAPGKQFPTVFIYGTVNGVTGIHRSIDEGTSWMRVNDEAHEYGGPANGQFVQGDMNVFGRVYMSTAGRGIVYGESDQTCIPTNVVSYVTVNAGSPLHATIITVDAGNNAVLGATPESAGSWSWTGPGGFVSGDREITLNSVSSSQAGIYKVRYTNPAGCQSAAESISLTVIVKAISIIVQGADHRTSIDEKGGTLQMNAVFIPEDTDNKDVTWSVSGSGIAMISPTGLLTALNDGMVKVRATARDGSNVFGETDITITNQNITAAENTVQTFASYPNPCYDDITIEPAAQIERLVIRNIRGELVGVIDVAGNESLIVSMRGLSPGLYVIEFADRHKKTIQVKKIIKY